MKNIEKTTKTYKILNALEQGRQVSAEDARKRYDVYNLRAEIHRLRESGYIINTRISKRKNQKSTAVYSMGTPTREMIALAYKAKRLGIKL